MSLPPELRVLCFQLSSTPTADLPRLTPVLLRHVLRCQVALSSPAGNAAKADASASSVLVHKLKTQLSTLLNGKSSEGRFAAVVLIKAVVEVGGWEVLQGAESWVRGLLSALGKPDPTATKELCIIALTKIYCMTHPYQTLVREITTPTLPAFITSCLNLIPAKPSSKAVEVPSSLRETIFRSFSKLLPRHTTIYRPFITKIRLAARQCVAPTSSDAVFVPQMLREGARQLVVLSHQTAPKNAGGEEWGSSVRDLVQAVHETADQVFRAVVEDWESAAGYNARAVDVNEPLRGDGKTNQDLPPWTGIFAGIERLTGLLAMLAEYFRSETSTPVAIPLESIVDMIARMLSIAVPSITESRGPGVARLHPAIDRDERDGLWSGMPQIYIAALQLADTMAERMEEGFISNAYGILDQLNWVFPFGKHDTEFRLVTYQLAAKILFRIGQSLDRTQVVRLSEIFRACCHDLEVVEPMLNNVVAAANDQKPAGSNHNADTFLQSAVGVASGPGIEDFDSAGELLTLLLSCIPQQYLDLSLRSLAERTAILSHNKGAMLASILNPFRGKNGNVMAGILPHLTRDFGHDTVVEILLRPRMPPLPSKNGQIYSEEGANEASEDEEMDMNFKSGSVEETMPAPIGPLHHPSTTSLQQDKVAVATYSGFSSSKDTPGSPGSHHNTTAFGSGDHEAELGEQANFTGAPRPSSLVPEYATQYQKDVEMGSDEDESDAESVHLTMQLDTESDSDD